MPNGSRAPCTTSTGTATASSSGRRLGRGGAPRGAAGCSGNARQSTPIAPVASAVRQATRAPDERPPATSGRPPSAPAAQVLDHRDPGRVELVRRRRRAPAGDAVGLLDERDAEAERQRRARRRDQVAGVDAAAGAVTEHERAAGSSAARRKARAGPCGVSTRATVTPRMVPPRCLNPAAAASPCPGRGRAARRA